MFQVLWSFEDSILPSSSSNSNLDQSGPARIYHPNITYAKWISGWTSSLILTTKRELYKACRGVVKDDIRTAHYLLPYLLLSVLLHGEEDEKGAVLEEMLSVLHDCIGAGSSPMKGTASIESCLLSTQKVFYNLIPGYHLPIDRFSTWSTGWVTGQKRSMPKKKDKLGWCPQQLELQQNPNELTYNIFARFSNSKHLSFRRNTVKSKAY